MVVVETVNLEKVDPIQRELVSEFRADLGLDELLTSRSPSDQSFRQKSSLSDGDEIDRDETMEKDLPVETVAASPSKKREAASDDDQPL